MMKNYFIILFCFLTSIGFAQSMYSGNGNSGFGGVIGTGSLSIDDDGTTITFQVTKGSAGFFDAMVIYLDTAPGGRAAIDSDVNDQQDPLRRAISSAGDNASVLTFPTGFEPDYAMAIDVNFGGLWSIPASGPVGNDELPYQTALNSTLSDANDASFTFDVDWSELGLTSSDGFKFVAIYLNANNGFTSDESFGSDIAGGNVGGNDLMFMSFFEYGDTLSNAEFDTNNSIKVADNTLLINNYTGNLNINVYDITGKTIKTVSTASQSDNFKLPLGLSSNQIYMVAVEGSNFKKTLKVIVH
ncbi:T9SS type A sorting domain-containing protein [Psychroserpens sp. XS_ASV72]|uniref:T9SS type A sorting domain-containing protein n=1 Tax=Psychroserpens sp. XS_ASV72 TaxID=3241293 RepID=UPI00351785A3